MDENVEENITVGSTITVEQGDGTEANPYLVYDKETLSGIRNNLAAHYKMIADIDMQGENWTAIGKSTYPFKGTLDGNGHCIVNLQMDGSAKDFGLFAYANGATFCNLRMENCTLTTIGACSGMLVGYAKACVFHQISIKGIATSRTIRVGLLTGYMRGGSISCCACHGDVVGTGYVGGLVGQTLDNAIISNCYVKGNVTNTAASAYVGGVTGYGKKITISNCYTACKVTGGTSGLVDVYSNVTTECSYFDSQVAGLKSYDECNIGKITSGLTKKVTFPSWDFDMVWDIVDGETYPFLRWLKDNKEIPEKIGVTGGAGTEEDPYQIENADGLRTISCEPSAYYKLITDIDLSGKNMIPIGTTRIPFGGELDGDGHVISNLQMVLDSAYVGLFGCVRGATIKNLRMSECVVDAKGGYVGTLAGHLENCTIKSIVISGKVTSRTVRVGLLAGYASGGTIDGCSGCGDVYGPGYVGGLIGHACGGIVIKHCFAQGKLTNTANAAYAGGIVGWGTDVTIGNAVSVCSVNGAGCGLIGGSRDITVENSYFDKEVAEIYTPANQARTSEELKNSDTYANWPNDGTWIFIENSYPVLKEIAALGEGVFDLIAKDITYTSFNVMWNKLEGAKEYILEGIGEKIALVDTIVPYEKLTSDTVYECKLQVVMEDDSLVNSRVLSVKTRPVLGNNGLHCTEKTADSITMTWKAIDGAIGYEIICNENIVDVDSNNCVLSGLMSDMPYVIQVKALYEDGGSVISTPVVEKIYELNPQTEYASEFIEKCEGQAWFMDEVEYLLNKKGKSINTITSRQDFEIIHAIGLSGREISGKIPVAIGELQQLEYLYLDNNELNGELPEEMERLNRIMEMDLIGNHFING